MNHDTITRVERGAKLLDNLGPKRWWVRIDLASLSMRDAGGCILGQLFGEYSDGVRALFPAYDGRIMREERENGFLLDPKDWVNTVQAWYDLKQAWLAEIQIRRESEGTRN
jgi:hypothetical protein